jgi:hypothetical protein
MKTREQLLDEFVRALITPELRRAIHREALIWEIYNRTPPEFPAKGTASRTLE